MEAELTLRESAEQLRVHYMTVYRYVRLGLLRADKVKGTWRVLASDLDAFRESASLQLVADQGGRRRAPWAERLESRLVAGDGQGSWGVSEAALASGATLEDVYLALLTPALQSIGRRRQRGELDVAVERRAAVIAFRLVGRLGPRFTRRGRNRGAVIVGSAEGETHAIAVAMTADILRHHGWDVSDLGADVPSSAFASMTRMIDAVVSVGLWVSAATSAALDSTAAAIAGIRETGSSALVVVGGDATLSQDHAVALGADRWVADARQFVELLDSIELGVVAVG
ncbi:MAG: cobalamin-dependent protein [Ilumatobacteraceae bacterium]